MSLLLTFMDLDRLYEEVSTYDEWIFTGSAIVPQTSVYSGRSFAASELSVRGKSEADALKNVKYVIRKQNNLPDNTPLRLFDYTILKTSELTAADRLCKICNKAILSDGGLCPICDDGEEYY